MKRNLAQKESYYFLRVCSYRTQKSVFQLAFNKKYTWLHFSQLSKENKLLVSYLTVTFTERDIPFIFISFYFYLFLKSCKLIIHQYHFPYVFVFPR